MIKELISLAKIFSFKFLFRSLFIKILDLKQAEIRQLDVAKEIVKNGTKVITFGRNTISITSYVNERPVNVVLRKHTSDLFVFNQVILQNEYAPLRDLVLAYCKTNDVHVILDAGANIGLASVYLSTLFTEATIFAIEPSKSNFVILKENIRINGLTAVASQKALLPQLGRVKLENTFRDRRDWSTRVIASNDINDIECAPLSTMMREFGVTQIDILKMDIEGHEREMFESEEFLNDLSRIRFIAIEVHEEKADRIVIVNKLQERGYKVTFKGETIFGVNMVKVS